LLAGFPVAVNLSAEMAAGGDLVLSDGGLFVDEKTRTRFAAHSLSQAVVRTVAGFGVTGAGAAGLAAPDHTF